MIDKWCARFVLSVVIRDVCLFVFFFFRRSIHNLNDKSLRQCRASSFFIHFFCLEHYGNVDSSIKIMQIHYHRELVEWWNGAVWFVFFLLLLLLCRVYVCKTMTPSPMENRCTFHAIAEIASQFAKLIILYHAYDLQRYSRRYYWIKKQISSVHWLFEWILACELVDIP